MSSEGMNRVCTCISVLLLWTISEGEGRGELLMLHDSSSYTVKPPQVNYKHLSNEVLLRSWDPRRRPNCAPSRCNWRCPASPCPCQRGPPPESRNIHVATFFFIPTRRAQGSTQDHTYKVTWFAALCVCLVSGSTFFYCCFHPNLVPTNPTLCNVVGCPRRIAERENVSTADLACTRVYRTHGWIMPFTGLEIPFVIFFSLQLWSLFFFSSL